MSRYGDTKEIPDDKDFPEFTEAFPDLSEEYAVKDYAPGQDGAAYDEAFYDDDAVYEEAAYGDDEPYGDAYDETAYAEAYAAERVERKRQGAAVQRGGNRRRESAAGRRRTAKPSVRSTRSESRRAPQGYASRANGRRGVKKANKDVLRRFGQRLIAVFVALLLIVLVALIAFGGRIKESIANHEEFGGRWVLSLLYPEKYSYGTEMANKKDYFQLFSDDDVAIILQDERIAAHAKYIDNTLYFSLDTVRELFTKRFYVNEAEGVLLYTTSAQVIRNVIGERSYEKDGAVQNIDGVIGRYGKDGTFYIAADYVRLFANFDYSYFTDEDHANRVQVHTSWEDERIAQLKSDTMLRLRGGIKSEVLREVKKGEEVKVLDVMETWTKVKTSDAYIGFVENKTLGDAQTRSPEPVSGAYDPLADYPMTPGMERVLLGWHQIFDTDSGSGMEALTANATGMNVLSPTWYFLQNEEGDMQGIPSHQYVDKAHAKGYQVWPLVENLEADFDEEALFSSSERRAGLIKKLMNAAAEYGFDGINMDVELTDAKLNRCGSHYVQFLRELSIACRERGLSLSVDVPVPTESNKAWDFEELGIVCDYVVIMAYDEHYAGSDAGSVASLSFVEEALDNVMNRYRVPAAKVVCGVPFYTRIWLTEGSSVNSEAVGMDTAREWMESRNLDPVWEEDAGQYYVEYKDGAATYQLWMEEERSMAAKVSVVSGRGVRSIAAWKLGLESTGIWDSINAQLQ